MDEAPRLLARDPAPPGNPDATVERHRRLVRDERPPQYLPRTPRLVLPECIVALQQLHVDPGRAQLLEPAGRNRIRIEGTHHDTRDAGVDHGIGARWRASLMRARLERHIQRCAARAIAGLRERPGLGVVDGLVFVPTLADDVAVLDDDCSDERMIFDLAAAAFCELERPLDVVHASAWTNRRYERGKSSRWKIELPATISVAPAS